uniref:SFRICE_000932 n=1 Tax=Spodoptera frugiperda TaxID=7108 RepID=A0A2H1V9L0_SPOFR
MKILPNFMFNKSNLPQTREPVANVYQVRVCGTRRRGRAAGATGGVRCARVCACGATEHRQAPSQPCRSDAECEHAAAPLTFTLKQLGDRQTSNSDGLTMQMRSTRGVSHLALKNSTTDSIHSFRLQSAQKRSPMKTFLSEWHRKLKSQLSKLCGQFLVDREGTFER